MTKQSKLIKAQAKYAELLNVLWWELSEDEQFLHGEATEKVVNEISDLQNAIAREAEVKATVKSWRDRGLIEKVSV